MRRPQLITDPLRPRWVKRVDAWIRLTERRTPWPILVMSFMCAVAIVLLCHATLLLLSQVMTGTEVLTYAEFSRRW